jgi:hypothetical protein
VLFIITTIRPIFEYAHIDIFNSDLAFDVLRGFKNLNKKSFRYLEYGSGVRKAG